MATDMTCELVDVFTYKDRMCAIVKANVPDHVTKIAPSFISWHNGYVSVSSKTYSEIFLGACIFGAKKFLLSSIKKLSKNKIKIGYISIQFRSYNLFINQINSEELTFSGYLDSYKDNFKINGKGWSKIYFFGFDSAHLQDDAVSKSYESVKYRTIKLANEMIKKGV